MILHVTFTDGSNPWVSLSSEPATIKKLWQQWEKNHPNTAQPVAIAGTMQCKRDENAGFAVYWRYTPENRKHYKYLGNALRAAKARGR